MSSTITQFEHPPTKIGNNRLKNIDAGERLYPIICCLRDDFNLPNLPTPPRLKQFLEHAGPMPRHAMLRYLCTGTTTSPFPAPTTARERILRPSLDELFSDVHQELYDTVQRIVDIKGGDRFLRIVLGRLFCCFGAVADVADEILQKGGIPGYNLPAGSETWSAVAMSAFPDELFMSMSEWLESGGFSRSQSEESEIMSRGPLNYGPGGIIPFAHIRRSAIPVAEEVKERIREKDILKSSNGITNPLAAEFMPLAAIDPGVKCIFITHPDLEEDETFRVWCIKNIFNRVLAFMKSALNIENIAEVCSPDPESPLSPNDLQDFLLTVIDDDHRIHNTTIQLTLLKLLAQWEAKMIGPHDQSYFKIKGYLKDEIKAEREARRRSTRDAIEYFSIDENGETIPLGDYGGWVSSMEKHQDAELRLLEASRTPLFVLGSGPAMLDARLKAALVLMETGEETSSTLR